jgi:hypothetical protein
LLLATIRPLAISSMRGRAKSHGEVTG